MKTFTTKTVYAVSDIVGDSPYMIVDDFVSDFVSDIVSDTLLGKWYC